MAIADRVAAVNRRVTNKVLGPVAGRMPPYALIHHVGRRSGRAYVTPVSAFGRHGTMAVPLPYGAETDWVKNLMAARGGRITYRGRTRAISSPRVVDRSQSTGLSFMARRWSRFADLLVFDVSDPHAKVST